MIRYFFISFLLLISIGSYAQLYRQPTYPQYYFRWPTDLDPDIVANLGELRPNHWHMGLDIRTQQVVNKRVLAAADGYISFVGIKPMSYGRWIIITHPNGLSTLYGHLNAFEPRLEAYVTEQQYKNESWEMELEIPEGKFPVKKGDFISYSGTTGGSGGPHIHFEIIETKTGKRLNPTLFGTPIADNIPPTITNIVMYDRDKSTYYQSPQFFKLTKSGGEYTVAGKTINTDILTPGFAIQAYDTRNGTSNQDGIYSARLFLDEKEISSFYLDSIDYVQTRYMNAQIDYKLKYNGGAYLQHLSPLPGDKSGVYKTLGDGLFQLTDTLLHEVKVIVSDANKNSSVIRFNIRNNGQEAASDVNYDWKPNGLNSLFKYDFEAYLPINVLYDKMNIDYTKMQTYTANNVSATHKLGAPFVPAQQPFEVRVKPDKTITESVKDRILIKRTDKKTEVKKAQWRDGWLAAEFREFGSFEAVIDTVPPVIPSIGAGEIVSLSKAGRIAITPTDNYGIANFRAEVDGKWLRFTNDKGRTWIYNFDNRIDTGIHTLSVTVTDIAGNKTTRNWKFSRGVSNPSPSGNEVKAKPAPMAKPATDRKNPTAKSKTSTHVKKSETKPAVRKATQVKANQDVKKVKKK